MAGSDRKRSFTGGASSISTYRSVALCRSLGKNTTGALTYTDSPTSSEGGFSSDPVIIDDAPWFPVAAHYRSPYEYFVRIDPTTNAATRVLATAISDDISGGAIAILGDSVWMIDPSGAGQVLRLSMADFLTP